MDESREPLPVSHDSTFGAFQQQTARYARYEAQGDPEGILRRGLVEEIAEYLEELPASGTPDPDKLTGELGDVLWYVSEIARHHGTSLATLSPAPFMNAAQQIVAERPDIATIRDHEGNTLDPVARPHEAIAVVGLRVVDVLNPKNDALWLGHSERAPLTKALGDLLQCTALLATQYGVRLSDAASDNMEKLANRARKPHVIEESAARMALSSRRDRLAIDPWVNSLLYNPEFTQDISRFSRPQL